MPELIATSSEIESSIVINENEGGLLLPDESLEEYFARKEQEMIDEMVAEQERNADAERARMEQEEKLALEREDIRLIENFDPSTKVRVEKVVVKDTKTYERASSSAPSKHEKSGALTESKPQRMVDGKIIDADGSSVLAKMAEKGNVPPEGLARAQKREQELAAQGYSISETFRSFNGDGKMWRTVYRVNGEGELTYENYQVSLVKTPATEQRPLVGESPFVDQESPSSEDQSNADSTEDAGYLSSDNRIYSFFDSLVARDEITLDLVGKSKDEVATTEQQVVSSKTEDETMIAPKELAPSLLEEVVYSAPETIAVAREEANDASREDVVFVEEVCNSADALLSVETTTIQAPSSIFTERVAQVDSQSPALVENVVVRDQLSSVAETAPLSPVSVAELSTSTDEAVSENGADSEKQIVDLGIAPERGEQVVISENIVNEQAVAAPESQVENVVNEGVSREQYAERVVIDQGEAENLVIPDILAEQDERKEKAEHEYEDEAARPTYESQGDVVIDSEGAMQTVERAENRATAPLDSSQKEALAEPMVTSRPEVASTRPSSEDKKEIVIESTPRLPEKNGIRLVRSPRTEESRPERSSAVSIKENSVNRSPAELSKPYEVRTSSPVTRVESAYPRPTLQPKASLQQDVPTTSVEIPASHSRPALTLNGVTLKRAS